MIKLPEIKNKKLLEEALTHRSYLNESKERVPSNERLEFLGDSVLSLIVSTHLFESYPDFNEGKLTNLRSLLVNTRMLADIAREFNLGEKLRLSRGEEDSGGRNNQSMLADTFEAVLGAIYLDGGIDEAEKFVNSAVLPRAEGFITKDMLKDPKSLLQESVQAKKQSSPQYRVLEETGPAHARNFVVGVYVLDKILGQGKGKSKQEAEEKAAEAALGNTKNK